MFNPVTIPAAWSPWLVLLGVALYGVVHSLLASLRVKAWASGVFGSLSDRGYRLFYNLIGAISLAPVLLLPATLPDRTLYTIPFPWIGLTLLIQLIAMVGLIIGLKQTGIWEFLGLQQLTIRAQTSQPGLVITGLYRFVRHPLYTAGLIFIWFIPVMTANLLALNLGLTMYIIIGTIFEERKLVRTFGQEYLDYRRRTPMLFPAIKSSRGN